MKVPLNLEKQIHIFNQTRFTPPPLIPFKGWVNDIIFREGKTTGFLEFYLMGDKKLLKLNQTLLNHNDYTDIITVPLDIPSQINQGNVHGEIYISTQRVKENARIFNVSLQAEFLRVCSHGVFHLMGYKDKSEEDQQIMRQKENTAIQVWCSTWNTSLYVPRET